MKYIHQGRGHADPADPSSRKVSHWWGVARIEENRQNSVKTKKVQKTSGAMMNDISLSDLVAYLGPEGTYSHAALLKFFGGDQAAIPVGEIPSCL